MEQRTGLQLVKRVARVAEQLGEVREATTGRVVCLPRVWAVAAQEAASEAGPATVPAGAPAAQAPQVQVAFYRKYTEAMLRRYLRLSMAAGRVPSLLGRELFRGQVTNYQVNSFEDVVIFCIDIEKCLAKMDSFDRKLIKRIALQQYSQGEAAVLLGISLRNCLMQYGRALDRLTTLLLKVRLLEPLKSCQGGAASSAVGSY